MIGPSSRNMPRFDWLKFAKSIKKINRPVLVGDAPPNVPIRSWYVFTQAIRSNAARGLEYYDLHHLMIDIHGEPELPRPRSKEMKLVLEVSEQYIRESRATLDGSEVELFADATGRITIRKSKQNPHRFSFRFVVE
jgi:hypothetical protein